MNNKVAIVTGAGAGIGRAIALSLSESCPVILVDKDLNAAQSVERVIRARGDAAFSFVIDIADDNAPAQIVQFAEQAVGGPVIVVNNAAEGGGEAFAEVSRARFDRVFDVSVSASFFLTQAVVPAMKAKGWGRIVNVSSLIAAYGYPGNPHYAGAKAAMIGFTRSWALELAPFGITANAVLPALTDTPMTQVAFGQVSLAERAKSVPAGRLGTAEDIAALVAYLCSDSAAFVTGQCISPNGGQYVGAL
jgi:NAD(P)-dependent dehydrogenase (short-subunit alcohol dehydrogenase family)